MFLILLFAITLIALSYPDTLWVALCTTPYDPLPSFYEKFKNDLITAESIWYTSLMSWVFFFIIVSFFMVTCPVPESTILLLNQI